jgi:glycosyltransferase involved in cell wall biosynthesis
MNPVAGAKKIAAPDPLQTDKEIAIFSRIDPFQFIRESDWPHFPNANYPTGCPFFLRPILSSKKGCLVTGGRQRASDASQICFRAAAGRKTAPNKSNVQFLGSLYLHAVSTIIVPMSGETLNPTAPPRIAPRAPRLPKSLLYSIFARIGGWGLDTDAFETLRASYRGGFLGKAIAYDNRQNEIPASKILSLRWHPVRLLSSLDRPYYYGAKKKYLDWIASRQLGTGQYDLFHSWSGDCLESLRVAQGKGIASIVEIPTWHRDFAERVAPRSEPQQSRQRTPIGRWKNELVLRSERSIEEYDLATLLVVLSERAAETFREKGMAKEKLFYLPRGVDVQRFKPGVRPPIFRAIFSGALIERKGIHHLLEAWHRLNLKDAELWLLGSIHEEAKPHLKEFWRANIRTIGFARDVEKYLSQATIHIFPSQLEGSAKVTYEAAACGLPQVVTRESGDVVRDGVEGIIVRPGDVNAIAGAIEHFYQHPRIVSEMSVAARKRVVENFTWDHFRERLLGAYEMAMQLL